MARRAGAITGSSFYVGIPPAMAMIYCEQLVLVLRIAAIYRREPNDGARAAEILFLQRRHPSVAAANKALQAAGASRPRNGGSAGSAVTRTARQLPSMIGLQLRRLKARSPVDMIIGMVELVSFLIPVVSIPAWVVANARATRRLGLAALELYTGPRTDDGPDGTIVLPPRFKPRTRRLVFGIVVPLALVLGLWTVLLPIGRVHHGLRWLGLALAELALVVTFGRLIWVTRDHRDASQRSRGTVNRPLDRVDHPTSFSSSGDDVEFRLKQDADVLVVEVERRTGRCATHGVVAATREVPRLQFPYLVYAVRRQLARRRPFRCPTCRAELDIG
jgi:hypothetical protein